MLNMILISFLKPKAEHFMVQFYKEWLGASPQHTTFFNKTPMISKISKNKTIHTLAR